MKHSANIYILRTLLLMILFSPVPMARAQSDKEDCSEHPLIPTRIPDYYIGNCELNDYSSHVVVTAQGEKTVEGKKTVLEYFLREGGKGVSETYVRKNYMEAIRKQGADIGYESSGRGVGVIKQADGTTFWVDVAGYVGDGTPEQTGHFYLTIVEVAPMEQVITARTLSDELKSTGRSVLYILFDTGKSTIRPESEKMIAQMAAYLNANRSVAVFIVGHTDNVGSPESNMVLSEQRATAVVSALVNNHGVSAGQVTARGVGPLAPLASNASEQGRKLNRRVEMVLR